MPEHPNTSVAVSREASRRPAERATGQSPLARAVTDMVIVAELLRASRIETVRIYCQPTQDDKARAMDQLITDRGHPRSPQSGVHRAARFKPR